MNFYYIEKNKNDPKNRSTYMICCENQELKTKLEDEFECIEAINQNNGTWILKGLDRLSKDYELLFDENATGLLHITNLSQEQLEDMFYNDMISVYKSGKVSNIFSNLTK
jgi:NADP-dependent 3-hydroxy acid dehydrogenase YdfG